MTDVFSDPKTEDPKGAAPDGQNESDPLAGLVGEGRKFKTVEDLARGKLESDKFIENLTSEQKELRDYVAELESKLQKVEAVKDVMGSKGTADGDGNQPKSLPTEEILKLVDERLNQRTAAQRARANEETANSALLKHFNNDDAKAREFVKQQAERLGMDRESLKELSKQSPEAFLRLVGINQPRANPGATFDNAVNPDASGTGGTIRNAAYYNNLRKELGHKFFEPRIQQQRLRDRQALGDKFFS